MSDNIEDYPVTPLQTNINAIDSAFRNEEFTVNTGNGFLCNSSSDNRLELINDSFQHYHIDKYNRECMNSMYSLFLAGRLTDITLKVGSEIFSCHKVVLAGASAYFRAMFTNGMREANMHEIPIHCISPMAINRLIHFIYTGEILIGESNVCELLAAATMLQMHHVVEACCEFLEKQFHPSNVIGIFEFASTNGCSKLSEKAQKYIDSNFNEIARYDEFICLKPCQLIQFIKRDELNVHSEAEVFNSVIRWTNHDRSNRTVYLFEILSHVRLHQMPPHFIRSQIKNCKFLYENPMTKGCLEAVLDDLLQHKKVNSHQRTAGFNQVLYSAGGYYRHSLATFECYSPLTRKWHKLSDIPTARSGLAACSVHGRVYLIGGRNNSELYNFDTPHVDCYDPQTNSWQTCAPMSIPRHRVAVGVIDDIIYAVGGSATLSIQSPHPSVMHHNSAEKFDPDNGQWTPVASMNNCRIGLGVATVNRLLYAVGGFDGENRLGSVERYNPDDDNWEFVASLNRTRSGAGVVALDQYIYAIGGYDSACQLRSVERYDPDKNMWVFVAPMIRPRSALGATVYQGKIWVFGGYDGNEFLTSVEVYDPSTNLWSEMTKMDAGKSGHAVLLGREPCFEH